MSFVLFHEFCFFFTRICVIFSPDIRIFIKHFFSGIMYEIPNINIDFFLSKVKMAPLQVFLCANSFIVFFLRTGLVILRTSPGLLMNWTGLFYVLSVFQIRFILMRIRIQMRGSTSGITDQQIRFRNYGFGSGSGSGSGSDLKLNKFQFLSS